jgi:hypothetical protein
MSRAVKMKINLFVSIYVWTAVLVNEFRRKNVLPSLSDTHLQNNFCGAIRILEGRRYPINSVYETFILTTEI